MFNYFYHERIRKSVATFGALFNNIYVLRNNSAGETISQVRVPLSYGPKRSFLDRIAQTYNGEESERLVAIKLPRMSFEITGITYDSTRQLQKTNYTASTGTNSSRGKFNQAVPYTLSFQLSIYAKAQDDALQVVEQIMPYFNPHYTLTIKPFENYPDIKEDVPLTLTSVSFSDDYEGALEQRRTIVYTLDFEMKVNFYGHTDENGAVIRQVINNFGIINSDDENVPLERLQIDLDPLDATVDSDFGFTNTWTDLQE